MNTQPNQLAAIQMPNEVADAFIAQIIKRATGYERDVVLGHELTDGGKYYYYELTADYIDPTFYCYECPWGNEAELAEVSFGALDCTVDIYDEETGEEEHRPVDFDDARFEEYLTNLN